LLGALGALALATSSAAALVVGIGDESPAAFTNTWFQQLGVQRTRLITPYDTALVAGPASKTDTWMASAQAAHEEIVVALSSAVGSGCPGQPCKPASARQFTTAFKAFHKRWPLVHIFQPANEVNSITEATAFHPEAVVTYYQIVKKYCHGCTVVGADLEDLSYPTGPLKKLDMVRYIKVLLKDFHKAHVATPHLWGMHNYVDVNYFHSTGTTAALKALPGEIWLTETGGIAKFVLSSGKTKLPYSTMRQTRATNWMMQLALAHKRITRIYIYDLFYAPINRFDSSLLGSGQVPRGAYYTLLHHWKSYFH
jgi:hypothetical protein